ncbi:MAG: T9SS type A sorting domain-containing protein [Bacteroidales bacterium]|nr:T9SS type A sorting domain-containing protein [Bacteroidales bacterium]
MKKILFLPLILLISATAVNAQEIVTSGGDFFKNSSISVSWTLGETITETISDGTNILTQGFQQSRLSATEIFSVNSDSYAINLFPNPAENIINIKVNTPDNLQYQFLDINGRILKEATITNVNTEIKVNNLPVSVYFLKIYNNNRIIKTYKIIKQ